MILQITYIPNEGLEKDFSEKDGWVQEKLSRALHDHHRRDDKILGHFSVQKTVNNLTVSAEVHLPIHATCDRCLKPYDYEIDVQFVRLLTPLFESAREKEIHRKEEMELTKDDINFSFFEGEEIDIGDILAEQVLLEQPIIYLCRPDCKGLCPACGLDRNEKACTCTTKSLKESPFAVLKNWNKD